MHIHHKHVNMYRVSEHVARAGDVVLVVGSGQPLGAGVRRHPRRRDLRRPAQKGGQPTAPKGGAAKNTNALQQQKKKALSAAYRCEYFIKI
jgi:hypothetical protein